MNTQKMDKELLILLVQNEPRLWDQREAAYHNRDIKSELWEAVASQVHPTITGEQVRKTWENLRDTFRRHLKKRNETKSGQGASEIVKWPFFNTLMFLKDVMTPRESSGNLPSTPNQNEPYPSDLSTATLDEENTGSTEPHTNRFIEEPEVEASGSESTSFAKPHPQGRQISQSLSKSLNNNGCDSQLSKRQKRKSLDSQVLEIEKRKISLMEQRFSRPANNDNNYRDDDDYAFFMSLLPTVKQLTQIEKMRLRMKIMENVTDALETHSFVNEVRSSRVIPSPTGSHVSSLQHSPYLSPAGTEGSQHSQSSSVLILNQASQPELQPSQQELCDYNLQNL